MRILYVTPHLSTGGMPEYLRRKVELLKDDHDVWVVEKRTEPAYRSIRDKIEEMLGERLIALNNVPGKLIDVISEVRPDVVHFEELSDYHFQPALLDQIYTKEREYLIFDTLHDSSIDHTEKRFIPDKMLVVSPWQVRNFLNLGVPVEMLEHEIVPGRRDRSGLLNLGLDPRRRHVLQVGLFSKRKNQSETISLARLMPDVEFHFVGNQTENYRDYWAPLLENLPENCRIWGERSDTENFYSCMDCVIFPSRGEYGDRETNPLVIRETIAWGVPLFLRDRDFYMGMYSESGTIRFMSDSITKNSEILYGMIKQEKKGKNMELDKEFFKRKLFNITFEEEGNKITFEYLDSPKLDVKLCIRDIDTEVPIYSFDLSFEDYTSLWCVPIPKPYYDFKNNPNFGGFLYDFYKDGVKVHTAATRIKPTAFRKDKFRLETFEPLFINYEQFFTNKIYEEFFNQIDSLEVVADIGANVGLFTELSLRKGAKKVISSEINDLAIDLFNSIHGENKNVVLTSNGISKEDGLLDIFIDPNNSTIGSIHNLGGSSQLKSIPTISLDNFLKDYERVSLVKVDIEGAEYDVFRGVSDKTLSKIDNVLLEFHHNFGGILRDTILDRLEQSGFTYEIYQDDCVNYASEWEDRGTIFAKRAQ